MKDRAGAGNATPLQRALDAERAARDAVEATREEADRMEAEARSRARTIGRRADERIARVARGARAETERLLAEHEQEEHAALQALAHVPDEAETLEMAAETVADRLIGAGARAAPDRADPNDE